MYILYNSTFSCLWFLSCFLSLLRHMTHFGSYSTSLWMFMTLFCFETGFCSIVQAGFKFTIFLLQSSKLLRLQACPTTHRLKTPYVSSCVLVFLTCISPLLRGPYLYSDHWLPALDGKSHLREAVWRPPTPYVNLISSSATFMTVGRFFYFSSVSGNHSNMYFLSCSFYNWVNIWIKYLKCWSTDNNSNECLSWCFLFLYPPLIGIFPCHLCWVPHLQFSSIGNNVSYVWQVLR